MKDTARAHGAGPAPARARTPLGSLLATARAMLGRTRPATPPRPAPILLGVLLGLGLLFVLAIGATRPLDAPLTVALYAFVSGLSFLFVSWLFLSATFESATFETATFERDRGELPVDDHAFAVRVLTQTRAPLFASRVLGEEVGGLAWAVGLAALIWHVSPGAVVVGVGTLALALVAHPLLALLWAERQAQQTQQDVGALPEPPGGAPQG